MDKDADAGEPQRMLRPQELVFIQSSDLHCLGFEMHTLCLIIILERAELLRGSYS